MNPTLEFAKQEMKRYGVEAELVREPGLLSFEVRNTGGKKEIAYPSAGEALYLHAGGSGTGIFTGIRSSITPHKIKGEPEVGILRKQSSSNREAEMTISKNYGTAVKNFQEPSVNFQS